MLVAEKKLLLNTITNSHNSNFTNIVLPRYYVQYRTTYYVSMELVRHIIMMLNAAYNTIYY
jgi:hypothetical protein